MFANIDHSVPEVRQEFMHWAKWLGSQVRLRGLRLDAIKHYSANFLRQFLQELDGSVGRNWFYVGEYWDSNAARLAGVVDFFQGRMSLFDRRLVDNFSRVSMSEDTDLRTVFDDALCLWRPANAVVRENISFLLDGWNVC